MVLALTACGGEAAPIAAPLDVESLSAMILHLPDGPVGTTIGDDGQCGRASGSDGDRGRFLDLVAEAGGAVGTCHIQLEGPDTTVESLVLSFPSEQLAVRAMTPDVFADVVRHHGLDCCGADPIGALVPAPGPGDEAVHAASASDASAVVGWRSGSLVGAV